MNKLEKLLNKLIKLGRKPRGLEQNIICIDEYTLRVSKYKAYSLNNLCSIDSGLWQFVVEKELYDIRKRTVYMQYEEYDEGLTLLNKEDLNYRLMLSSIQKDKTQFISDNIIINE